MNTRVLLKSAALALALVSTLTGCEANVSQPSTHEPVLASQASSVVGDGRLQSNEQCDDGNTTPGDGCSATGTIEAGFLCHVPGRACSPASQCGNNVINPGEACDDGNTTQEGNGCTATCDLSLCGNGVFDNREYPNFDQEICDDGNRFEGDGCSRQCEVEPGFACAGNPSRCVRAGVALFNTGVDQNNRRLESGADPHWFYTGSTTGAATGVRDANDWPQELQTARYMSSPLGAPTCVYQDFMVPTTTNISQFRVRLATFNDNTFASARVNGAAIAPVVISEPQGQPWQKNIIREFGTNAAWRPGRNRIELCNENQENPPNAFRYLFVDAYDDRCGDGAVSPREECDDGDSDNGDGCSASCGIEAGYGCAGQPSVCAQTCGNGSLNPGEQCDDGNPTNGDGCNASCRVEAGYSCPTPNQACVPTCGDGIITAGEQCDDGNVVGSDGCSAACRIENGYECSGAPSACAPLCGNSRLDSGEQCDDGNTRLNDGCSIACTLELGYACPTPGQACVSTCGNGTVNPGEQCDDGNLDSLDGCGTDCRVEPGYACSTPANGQSVCVLSCGNGALDANETCDDGNTTAGDGCSAGCRVETGYHCSGAPSACATNCGDGITAGTEACDDGNGTPGDGCATCLVEPGWSCPAPGNVCFNTCGNGTVESGELCDDGNTSGNDGCSATCRVENGYSCSGAPSVCRTSCGDGIVAGAEVCDDGNLQSGDTCSPRCLLEEGQPCMASGVCDTGVCDPTSDTCAAANVCGNGHIDEGELCDDGNTTAGDGCGAACTTIEAGYGCTGNPSVCAVTCGDGIKAQSEACDDGNTTAGDGCGATCTLEGGFGCKNPETRVFFTRLGRSQCTQVSDVNAPSLPESAIQASLAVPGRYRARYVSGAVSYSGGVRWMPGIFGFSANAGAGTQGFSLGYVPEGTPGSPTREEAMTLGFPLTRDFDAATGDVRLALVDLDCAANNNSETAATYRVDSLSICQLIPVLTRPGAGGTTRGGIGGTATPGATVVVYIDGSNTPACTTVANASGNWTCDLSSLPEGTHSAVVTSTILGATETGSPTTFIVDPSALAAPVITGPAQGSILANATPAISGTAEPGTTVTVREGDTVLCTTTVDAAGNWSCVPTSPLTDGAHSVTATASDGPHTSPLSAPDAFIIDTQAPDTTIPRGPGTRTDEDAASFEYDSNEEGVRYECSLDGREFGPCEDAYDVGPGTHTLRVRSVDAAGNVDASPAEYTWTVVVTRAFAGGGCSAAPASSGLALLALLGLRRRNRRQAGR
ncbi:DUF4215 domain-containing protein [Myxococcus sp. RHSTA-1-4]|uniref:DUF4215 domain-containing protein n=1 Tax=Myxococcus sp. RHSTA-1-4 TaxID=2874601 RepID=UPI001CBB022A|nr:DUF4215 domain-containing protein [Myxococcus sp. RHSTA-1-4]MBZ4419015.1 DUF4215 domain-containing protein [Myxococcus sp. RHSTA-1-4]